MLEQPALALPCKVDLVSGLWGFFNLLLIVQY